MPPPPHTPRAAVAAAIVRARLIAAVLALPTRAATRRSYVFQRTKCHPWVASTHAVLNASGPIMLHSSALRPAPDVGTRVHPSVAGSLPSRGGPTRMRASARSMAIVSASAAGATSAQDAQRRSASAAAWSFSAQ